MESYGSQVKMFDESKVNNAVPVMVRTMDGTVCAGDVFPVGNKIMLRYLDDDTLPDSMRGHDEMVVLKSGGRSNISELNKIHDLIFIGTSDGKTFKASTMWSNPARIKRNHTVMRDGSLIAEDDLLNAASSWKTDGRPKDRIIKGKTGEEVEDEMRARRGVTASRAKSEDDRRHMLLGVLESAGVSISVHRGSMSLDFSSCEDPVGMQSKVILGGLLGRPIEQEE